MPQELDGKIGRLEADVSYLREGQGRLEKSFYELHNEMTMGVNRIEMALVTRLDDHGKRLRFLEQWRSWIIGALAVFGLLWGAFLVWVKK